MDLTGIHHLTAITADAPGNNRFYTGTLGMRRVKKTVNQDDTSAYHLFFADGAGSPGTDLTFFDWPAAPERRGTRSISRTGLRVAEASLDYWAARLGEAGLTRGAPGTTDGRATLDFEDPEGQRFRLTADTSGTPRPWERSPVPAKHQIRGLGPITISVPELAPTEAVLTRVMNMRRVRDYPGSDGQVHVFEMGDGGPSAELHVVCRMPWTSTATFGCQSFCRMVLASKNRCINVARFQQRQHPAQMSTRFTGAYEVGMRYPLNAS